MTGAHRVAGRVGNQKRGSEMNNDGRQALRGKVQSNMDENYRNNRAKETEGNIIRKRDMPEK
jgi:hypothetical protein